MVSRRWQYKYWRRTRSGGRMIFCGKNDKRIQTNKWVSYTANNKLIMLKHFCGQIYRTLFDFLVAQNFFGSHAFYYVQWSEQHQQQSPYDTDNVRNKEATARNTKNKPKVMIENLEKFCFEHGIIIFCACWTTAQIHKATFSYNSLSHAHSWTWARKIQNYFNYYSLTKHWILCDFFDSDRLIILYKIFGLVCSVWLIRTQQTDGGEWSRQHTTAFGNRQQADRLAKIPHIHEQRAHTHYIYTAIADSIIHAPYQRPEHIKRGRHGKQNECIESRLLNFCVIYIYELWMCARGHGGAAAHNIAPYAKVWAGQSYTTYIYTKKMFTTIFAMFFCGSIALHSIHTHYTRAHGEVTHVCNLTARARVLFWRIC